MLRSRWVLGGAALVAVFLGGSFVLRTRLAHDAPDAAYTRLQVGRLKELAPQQDALRSLGYVAEAPRAGGPGAPALVQANAKAAATGSVTAPGLAGVFASLKLIRTASITVEVEKYDRAAEEVVRVAESLGGYLAEAQVSQGQEDRRAGTLTIRVPSARFGAALSALKGLGKVKAENVATQDVTKAYTDLETRLKVKRDTADRLRELLRTRTAGLPDVLTAERELARVTEEIEQMEGERRFYDQQVAFSTIALSLAEPHAIVAPGVFAPLGRALRDAAQVLVQSLSGLIFVVVALTPWLLVAYVVWRVIRSVRARRKLARAEA
jgi:hypothetical protein